MKFRRNHHKVHIRIPSVEGRLGYPDDLVKPYQPQGHPVQGTNHDPRQGQPVQRKETDHDV